MRNQSAQRHCSESSNKHTFTDTEGTRSKTRTSTKRRTDLVNAVEHRCGVDRCGDWAAVVVAQAEFVSVGRVTTKAKCVYQITDKLDTLIDPPEILMQVSGIGGEQKFTASKPASSDTVDPPCMPANESQNTFNNQPLIWYESDMQNDFIIWSGIIEVKNRNRGAEFIPIKQNSWKVHGNSSQQNQQATPSSGDGAAPTKVPNTQHPWATDHCRLHWNDPGNWSVENN